MQSAPSFGSCVATSSRNAAPVAVATPSRSIGMAVYACDPWDVQPVIGDIDIFTQDGPLDLIEDYRDAR